MLPALATELLRLHHEANHAVRGATGGPRDKLQKLDRPVLTTGCSQQDFRFFRQEWRRYATASNITDEKLLQPAPAVCGPFTAKDAPEQSDLNAKQEHDEAVRTCVARLCGLANICALSKKCTKVACTQDVSYMEPSILLALVKGLY